MYFHTRNSYLFYCIFQTLLFWNIDSRHEKSGTFIQDTRNLEHWFQTRETIQFLSKFMIRDGIYNVPIILSEHILVEAQIKTLKINKGSWFILGWKFQGLNFRLSLQTICEYGLEETMIVRRKGTINGPPVLKERAICQVR